MKWLCTRAQLFRVCFSFSVSNAPPPYGIVIYALNEYFIHPFASAGGADHEYKEKNPPPRIYEYAFWPLLFIV